MSTIKINLNPVADDIVRQLKSVVPVRTGRLRNGIGYQIKELKDGYMISLVMEDYFKWLKFRTKPAKLPTYRELSQATGKLPRQNTLGNVKYSELSDRSRSLIDKIDFASALTSLDKKELEEQIKDVIAYDKL